MWCYTQSSPPSPPSVFTALSTAHCVLVPSEMPFDDVEDKLAYVIAVLRLGSEKLDFPGTPPSRQPVQWLQVPTPTSVGPPAVSRHRPVTLGVTPSAGGKEKETDTGKTVLGMSTAIGEGEGGRGRGRTGVRGKGEERREMCEERVADYCAVRQQIQLWCNLYALLCNIITV